MNKSTGTAVTADRRRITEMRAVETDFGDAKTVQAWSQLSGCEDLATGTWFQSLEWHEAWWKHYGAALPHARKLLLRIDRGDETAAVLPLVVYTRRLLGMTLWRTVKFMGAPLSPYTDMLVRRENAHDAWRAAEDYLHRNIDHAWLECDTVLPGHSLLSAVFTATKTAKQPFETYLRIDTGKRPSDDGWRRKGLSKSLKRWQSGTEYRWLFVTGYDEQISETMIRYNRETFGGKSFFAKESGRRFFSDVCERAGEDVWYAILSHGNPCSIMMGFRRGSVLYHFMSGTTRANPDPNMRAGAMNTYHLLGYMQKHGYTVLDMLRGEERHKLAYGPERFKAEVRRIVPEHMHLRYLCASGLQRLRRWGRGR